MRITTLRATSSSATGRSSSGCSRWPPLVLGWAARGLHVDAGFAKLLPLKHPYMATFLKHQQEFGGANRVLVAVMARDGNMFTPQFFETLKNVTDEVFFLPGVDRGRVQSLFTPNVRYTEVVEDGIAAGNVIPDDFEPTPEGLDAGAPQHPQGRHRRPSRRQRLLRRHHQRRADGVRPDDRQRSSTSSRCPTRSRRGCARSSTRDVASPGCVVEHTPVDIHVIGFSKVIGDIAAGARAGACCSS